ncbi:MAG: Uma2 family endonuclease [Limnothrix sp. RL_2_0]|nr:Uma2 family endonuclease [Limnothrix sp. RL_2_0]
MSPVTYKFSVEDYHRMGEAEIFGPEKRLELIHGDILSMPPIGLKHAITVNRINQVFTGLFGKQVIVAIQNPLGLSDESEPQPDAVIYKARDDFYENKAPESQDVHLLIEVSDSTLRFDRQVKLPLYASNNIAEAWIANLRDKQLEIFREPTAAGYQQKQILKETETISPIAFPEITLTVLELLG